jgi:hypothetical protein
MIGINNIEGFNNYHITLCGKMISLKNNHNQDRVLTMKSCNQKNSYSKYVLRENGINKTFLKHRLIALAYLPNPENKPHINHKDGDKTNNCISNLEWATRSENMKHALNSGLLVPNSKGKHYRAKIVLDLETGVFYDSQKDFAEAKNIAYSAVQNHFRKSPKKSKYKFIQI